jgi:tripartite-type tricarboxylate transporter receptor subunit TctC
MLLVGFAGPNAAQDFPNKPVRLIIPFPAGGSSDSQARILGQALAEEWKQPVIVEFKPGAGTTIGAAYVAKSPPDGYTLFQIANSHTISASLYPNLPYDAVKSFEPIALVAHSPMILVVHPGIKANSLADLINLAKASPKKLNYGSSGSGVTPHLLTELLRLQTGIDVVHVPFKGTSPALTALLGGQVDFLFTDVTVVPLVESGRLRALAVSTAKRSPFLREVPTMAESGAPNFDTSNWTGLLAPAGTPREVVNRINTATLKALNSPAVRERFNKQGYETLGSTPEELLAHLNAEVVKYAKAIAAAGVRID